MSWEGLNRRKFPRANFPCLIKIIHSGQSDETILSHTENISTGGACVIIRKSLEMFAPVKLEIDLMDGAELIACQAKVVWSVRRKATEANKPSFYDTGFEFVDISQDNRTRVAAAVEHLVRFGRATAYR